MDGSLGIHVGLGITVGFVAGVEQIVDSCSYGDLLCVLQLEGVGSRKVCHEIGVERIIFDAEIVEILSAHILSNERHGAFLYLQCHSAVENNRGGERYGGTFTYVQLERFLPICVGQPSRVVANPVSAEGGIGIPLKPRGRSPRT